MDRGAWWAILHGVARVRPDLVTKSATTTSTKPEVVKNVQHQELGKRFLQRKFGNQARKLFD